MAVITIGILAGVPTWFLVVAAIIIVITWFEESREEGR